MVDVRRAAGALRPWIGSEGRGARVSIARAPVVAGSERVQEECTRSARVTSLALALETILVTYGKNESVDDEFAYQWPLLPPRGEKSPPYSALQYDDDQAARETDLRTLARWALTQDVYEALEDLCVDWKDTRLGFDNPRLHPPPPSVGRRILDWLRSDVDAAQLDGWANDGSMNY